MTDAVNNFGNRQLPDNAAHLYLVPSLPSELPDTIGRALYRPHNPALPLTNEDINGLVHSEQSALPVQAVTTVLLRCAGLEVDYTANRSLEIASAALERAIHLQALHLKPKTEPATRQRARRAASGQLSAQQQRDATAVAASISVREQQLQNAAPYVLFQKYVRQHDEIFQSEYCVDGRPDTITRIPELYRTTDNMRHPGLTLLATAGDRLRHKVIGPDRLLRFILLKTVASGLTES